jgi:predicted MFS family arabinose efflux permease
MVPFKNPNKDKRYSIKTVKEDLLAGFEFIRRNVVISYSLLKMMIITSALAVVCMLAIQFAEKNIGIGAKNFGYLVIFAGAGMLLGMWALGQLSHYFKKSTIVFSGFFMSGLALIFLAYTRNVFLSLIYCLILGFGNILINATIQTILAHKTPKSFRGRIFGIQNMLINFAFTLPVVVFGIIADYFGLAAAIFLVGLIVLLSGFLFLLVPKMRTV